MQRLLVLFSFWSVPVWSASCSNLTFPHQFDGQRCDGLQNVATGPMGNPITTADQCQSSCCAVATCTIYQFKAPPNDSGGCWTGTRPIANYTCSPEPSWVSRGRSEQPPSPPPPPCPSSPGLHVLCEHAHTAARPLLFEPSPNHSVSPQGVRLGADSRSLLATDSTGTFTRWFPVSGEVHLARLTASEWLEQLTRMKAGGLDMIAVYVFWIHHEEKQGKLDFSGRRDVRRFLLTAQQVGLRVLLRIGPWDHGECRNGGHPDWVLESCGVLRSNDPAYLSCVSGWYRALGAELTGLFHKDGGPIVMVQIDNETDDWEYLLALKQMAMSTGIHPVFYTKTGWPDPRPGYPDDYPMLPFFGGYADQFWTNNMHPDPMSGSYLFAAGTDGYREGTVPLLGVEIGGGMAAAYNHRVHMFSSDMPSMHTVDLANSFNGLGFYMYHGGNSLMYRYTHSSAGNNPHSTVHTTDDPNTTLQESSFQPAGDCTLARLTSWLPGAQNPMPSESYDFFAPLGEFGQPRQHFHQMRSRVHLLVRAWGSLLADSSQSLPVDMPSSASDNSTLRWAVRTNNASSGFVFVNNYQRLFPLPARSGVRLRISLMNGEQIVIPSVHSPAITVLPNSWFIWPLNVGVSGEVCVSWASAQLATRVSHTLVFVQTEGVVPEVALNVGLGSQPGASVTLEGKYSVLRNITMGTSAFAEVVVGGVAYSLVMLPYEMRDRLWVGELQGAERVMISQAWPVDPHQADRAFLLPVGDTLKVRTQLPQTEFWVCPGLAKQLMYNGTAVQAAVEGVFVHYKLALQILQIPLPSIRLVTSAAPARIVPLSAASKAQEPTAEDWMAAAEYSIVLSLPENWNQTEVVTELVLAIDYVGDAARVYFGNRLLTDNWFSGYSGDGAMQVGLSYLADENPGLLEHGAELKLLVLPLKRSTLDGTAPKGEGSVFLQKRFWPDFRANKEVLQVTGLRWVNTEHLDLATQS